MREVWKRIGEDLHYEVSNLGRFRSLDREVTYKDGRVYKYKGRLIKPYINNTGYYYVRTKINGKVCRYPLHRLVAKHFLENWCETKTVDHIDNNELNNVVTNLQMLSHRDNILKYIHKDSGEKVKTLGYKNAVKCRELYKQGYSAPKLGEMFGVSSTSIYGAIHNKTYRVEDHENPVYIETDTDIIDIVEGKEDER